MLTVWQLADWIEQNLHCVITPADMEAMTGYSSRHLRSLFHVHFGLSVTCYIRKRRLTLASVMLRETSRSVTEIALMYRFEHLQTFSRAFKKHFGQSPQQYRQAESWDMALYYPSAVVMNLASTATVFSISHGLIEIQNKKHYRINFGHDFFLSTEKRKIISYPRIYQDCIHLIFRHNPLQQFVAFGELLPGEGCDTEIDIYTGRLTQEKTERPHIRIPPGNYICFGCTGTPGHLMKFQAWVKGHGMHQYKQVLKKGPSFTVFEKTDHQGMYKSECYIPCLV
ncbi:helix-turn-helix transcriptional regulator [Salmonella enterica]|nr:helix-turn-helix transcriptional regulator [Salmonella enterica]